MTKYCPKCGTALSPDNKYCPKCGYQLAKQEDNSATSEQQGKPANDNKRAHVVNTKKVKKGSHKRSHKKWIIIAIIVIIAAVFGYRQVYVPHVIQSAITNNGFTSSHGYSAGADISKKQIVIYANSSAQQKIGNELARNEYDTRKINVENNLSNLAHDVSGKAFGKWQVILAIKQGQKTGVLWEFNGTKEVHRFQTSEEGREVRQEYLARLQQQQEQEQQERDDETLGAGLIGGGLGFLLGAL